ncbi:MAG: tetratricopeptide repeat protein [Deltaproteobacteria bacterium]|nr:tetratricopeptide repeat protein [Deltaproteobacteria bacterium]
MPENGANRAHPAIQELWSAALLAGAVTLVYANALSGTFQLDDFHTIVFNESIRNLGNLRAILLGGPRPVANLMNALDFALFGLSPIGYHATNIAIHAATCVLVWRLLRRAAERSLLRDSLAKSLCLGFAVLYAVHPLNTMAVTYIIQGRMAALAALVAVGCVLSFTVYADSGRRRWAVLSLSCLLVAVATKEHVVTLPLVLVAWDHFFVSKRSLKTILRERGIFHSLSFGLLAVLGGLLFFRYYGELLDVFLGRSGARDFGNTVAVITPYRYLLTEFGVILRYLRLMVLPLGQSAEYYWPVATSFFALSVVGPVVVLLGLAGTAAWFGRRNALIAFGALWFALFLLVESSIVPLEDVIFEHRAYLPFIGVVLLLVGVAQEALETRFGVMVASSPASPRLILGALLVLAVPYGAAAHIRNAVWQDTLTLYEDAYQKYPEHPRVRANLMAAYIDRGRFREGVQLFAGLPTYYREEPVVLYNAALAYFSLGQLEMAKRILQSIANEPYGGIRERVAVLLSQIAEAQAPAGTMMPTPPQ